MPDHAWRLVPYVAESGRIPINEFLDELEGIDPERYDYFQDVIRPLLEEHGPGLGEPMFKRLPPTEFCEIRWNGPDRAHYRLYCSVEKDRRLVFYHGVVKRWQKFDDDDKKVCRKRYADFHSPLYDANGRIRARAEAQKQSEA